MRRPTLYSQNNDEEEEKVRIPDLEGIQHPRTEGYQIISRVIHKIKFTNYSIFDDKLPEWFKDYYDKYWFKKPFTLN